MDYAGNFIYENTKLSFILTDEGRLVPDSSGFEYEYFIKDHLGNTRLTVKDSSGTATVMSEAHYYPFGLEINTLAFASIEQKVANKYLYNGKELQDDFGLGWYDYGARFYDAQLGRWHVPDPMSESYYSLSSYSYVSNNPIKNIDINGEWFSGAYKKWFNKIETYFKNKYNSKLKQIERKQIRSLNALAKGNMKKSLRIDKSIAKNEGQLKTIVDNFKTVSSEVIDMANSNQEYHIQEESGLKVTDQLGNTTEKGVTYFDFSSGAVVIAIAPNASTGIFAHELKHGFQFETGKLSLGARDATGIPFLYDKTDEIQAYKRQGIFGKTENSLPSMYNGLPSGPIDINNVKWYNHTLSDLNKYEYQSMIKRLRGNIAFRKNNKTYY